LISLAVQRPQCYIDRQFTRGQIRNRPIRRAASLLELVIVLTIIGILMALSFPAFQKARAMANRMNCENNLHQIGVAIANYHTTKGRLPYARLCPAPWRSGQDLHCETLPSPDTYTGPREIWWSPYDNRPGSTPTQAAPGYVPHSLLEGFIEGSWKMFQCPDGFDSTSGSPSSGGTFQVSYVLNPAIGGKKLTDPGMEKIGWLVHEHMDLPACPGAAAHWTTWPVDDAVRTARDEPHRHLGVMNVLGKDFNVFGRR
jgi:type II secretory pathway pseudopilin PulG